MEKYFASMFRRLQFTFPKGAMLYPAQIKSYRHYKKRRMACNVDNFRSTQDTKNAPSVNVNRGLLNTPAKYFSITRNYAPSVLPQRKYTFYYRNALLDAFRMNSCNIIGRNPSMVIPLLANQDLMPMHL